MLVSLNEAKLYLRVDHDDEDELITELIENAELLCENILRKRLDSFSQVPETLRHAVLYAVAQTYEFRENLSAATLIDNVKRLLFAYRLEVW